MRSRFFVCLVIVTLLINISAKCANSTNFVAFPPGIAGQASLNNTVYVSYNDYDGGMVVAYDAGTGKIRWKKELPDNKLQRGLPLSRTMLCVPTTEDGTFILNPSNGKIIKHINPGYNYYWQLDACNNNYLVLMNDSVIKCYKYPDLKLIWKYTVSYSNTYTYMIIPAKNSFELLLSDTFRIGFDEPKNFRKLIFRDYDGKLIANKRISPPFPREVNKRIPPFTDDIPENLPRASQKWLSKTLRFGSELSINRTDIVRKGDNWYVGTLCFRYLNQPKSKVYAVKGNTARILWSKEIPGLSEIILNKGTLFTISLFEDQSVPYKKNEISRPPNISAFDADTGKLKWKSKLP
ncbi:MAG: hypothetical protein ACYC27_09330 [Armatimonadota bacterium]